MTAMLTMVRRHDGMRRLGKRLEKRAKLAVYGFVSRYSRQPCRASSEALEGVGRVLIIRPNFRLGNAVIGARLIEALATARPDIAVDYLGADSTQQLFKHMPLRAYFAHRRAFSWRPWELLKLIFELRRNQYDLAIQVGEGSLTSWFFAQFCGAGRLLGQEGKLEKSYDWLVTDRTRHAYELPGNIAHALGLKCERLPWMVITQEERRTAEQFVPGHSGEGIIGVFVGGHLDKCLPLHFWLSLCHELNQGDKPYLVMVGPEEEKYRVALEQACGPLGSVLPLLPVREFAAVLTHVITLVTPDTGPMHIAAALGVPVVAVLNSENSHKFIPQGPADKVFFKPLPKTLVACLNRSPLLASRDLRVEHMLDRKMLLH